MEYKVIINAIIIIFIIYLILENINYSYKFDINNTKNIINENYENNKEKNVDNKSEKNQNNSYKENKSINFLTDDNDYVPNFDELDKNDCETDKNYVKPGNFWLDNNNNPNFNSNVTNVSKFYDINLDESSISQDEHSTPLDEITNYNKKELEKVIDYEQSKESCFLNKGNKPFIPLNQDSWKYKNESPMNGGIMNDGIVGFDNLNSGFALYDKGSIENNNCDNNIKCTTDDLRNGMSSEAQDARLNNT